MQLLRGTGLWTADWVLGLLEDGMMVRDHLSELFPALPFGVIEIYSHPTLDKAASGASGSRLEYEALVDPGIGSLLEEEGIRRTSCREVAALRLQRGGQGGSAVHAVPPCPRN